MVERKDFKHTNKFTSSWDLIASSISLTIKNYEQIAFFFFIPFLIFLLGSFYLSKAHISLQQLLHNSRINTDFIIGFILVSLWVIISFINYAPSLYFRISAVKKNTNESSVINCYKSAIRSTYKAWVCQLTMIILVLLGLLLLIVPGVILFRKYVLTPYYAVANPDLSIKEAFLRSSNDSRPAASYIYSTYLFLTSSGSYSNTISNNILIGARERT